MFEEQLLGFDTREIAVGLDHLWDAHRREIFLLQRDAPAPLSVDTLVWPSVFDTGQGIGLPAPERERLHLAGLSLPDYVGPNVGLWEDAEKLRRYLKEHWKDQRPCVVVAISWFSDQGFSGAGRFGPYLARTSPKELDPNWTRLGFDVADGSLVSGLTNCGFLPEEAQQLREQWGLSLNENHLFEDLTPAFQFRDRSDERVPSHAPFFVYGLYLVESLA